MQLPEHKLVWNVKRSGIAIAIIWTACICTLMVWNWDQAIKNARELARSECRAHFTNAQAFRLWASSYGGVYVPPKENYPPNPYLKKMTERDIVTPSGKKLTLMNPAYIFRQIMEEYEAPQGVIGHITSLNPIRPHNKADRWETKALQSFENGKKEAEEFTTIDDHSYLRLMKPLPTEQSCLTCHAEQGYKEGDIRGGISISIPTDEYYTKAYQELSIHNGSLAIVWVIGITGLGIFSYILSLREAERNIFVDKLKQLATISEQSAEGIAIVDMNGHLIYANHTWNDLHGFKDDENLIGSHISTFHTDNQFHNEVIPFNQKVLRHGYFISEIGHMRKDGSTFPSIMSVTVIRDDRNHPYGIAANMQDISDQKQAQAEKEILMKELKEKNSELQSIVYAASHDLKSPLVTISGFGKALSTCFDDLKGILKYANLDENSTNLANKLIDNEIPESLHYITSGIQKINVLINGLLQVSRAGSDELTINTIDMNHVIKTVCEENQYKIKTGNVEIRIDKLPPCIGDEKKINQIFTNLIDNAIKYLSPDRPGVISISGVQKENHCEYTVEDNGIGFKQAYAQKIFEVFHRLNVESDKEGEGLGLSIVMRLTHRLNGNIEAYSQEGQGSKFIITLPAEYATATT